MSLILLVDDELEILATRSEIIQNLGYDCITAKSGNEAIKQIRANHIDVILTDIVMEQGDGFALLNAAKEIDPDIPVILFTAYGTIESAVEAMKLGAFDYIQKPINKDILALVLKKAIEFRQLKQENLLLKHQVNKQFQLDGMIYKSQCMLEISRKVMKAAACDASVLIWGESGTGKEMIARNIHAKSNRKDNPFVPIDCVALPPTLMESELFGFEKGSFTNASRTKRGLLEIANGGTVFFDEITELDYGLQAKLLRVLQEQEFRHVGGTELIKTNIRIISATNQNPDKAVKEKKLRHDLYYRLNVIQIPVPPLRDRKEDIPLLVHHFIDEFNPRLLNEIKGITNDALRQLTNYYWPGNVRELRNVIEQVMSMAESDTIGVNDLPDYIKLSDSSQVDDQILNLGFQEAKEKCLNSFYKKYLGYLLKKYDGNISKVAKECGLSRWTIYRIIQDAQL